MCGGTAKTTNQPPGWQDSASYVSDAVSGAGRTCKTLFCTKIRKRARVGRGTDHTELDSRFEILILFQNLSEILIHCVPRWYYNELF